MKNDNGRLSEGTIKAIRLMIADNQSIDTIMETLRISRTTVYRWGFSNVPISEQVDATSLSLACDNVGLDGSGIEEMKKHLEEYNAGSGNLYLYGCVEWNKKENV